MKKENIFGLLELITLKNDALFESLINLRFMETLNIFIIKHKERFLSFILHIIFNLSERDSYYFSVFLINTPLYQTLLKYFMFQNLTLKETLLVLKIVNNILRNLNLRNLNSFNLNDLIMLLNNLISNEEYILQSLLCFQLITEKLQNLENYKN